MGGHAISTRVHNLGNGLNGIKHRFVNAEHTVARNALKHVGQVTSWTNKAGHDISHMIVKDAKLTAKGFGAVICVTAKHGKTIDSVIKNVAQPMIRHVMTAAGPETEAFIPALKVAEFAASKGFNAAGGWPALEKSGCRLA